jgi:hypothetical protein
MNLYDQIKDELISYQHLQDPKLLNHIQNDLTTLHDLVEEYHKYGYLDFDIKALMLLSMLSFNDLVVVSGQIRDNYLCIDYYTKLKDTLKETFKMNDLSAKYNIMITSIDTAIENDLERYITIIKHEQKLDEQYKQNYLKIIGLYFIYMCRKDKKYV